MGWAMTACARPGCVVLRRRLGAVARVALCVVLPWGTLLRLLRSFVLYELPLLPAGRTRVAHLLLLALILLNFGRSRGTASRDSTDPPPPHTHNTHGQAYPALARAQLAMPVDAVYCRGSRSLRARLGVCSRLELRALHAHRRRKPRHGPPRHPPRQFEKKCCTRLPHWQP